MRSLKLVALCSLLWVGCGGQMFRGNESKSPSSEPPSAATGTEQPKAEAAPPAGDAEADAEVPAETAPAEVPAKLPETCEEKDGLCLPPFDFTQRLCQGTHPSIAISMFEKHTPWTRGYVRMKSVNAINALGGPASDQDLVFGEQVLILAFKSGGGSDGFSVSGSGDYQVLRWDGSCASLAEHELVTWVPGALQHPPLVWRYLEEPIQEALLANANIKRARDRQRKECRGGTASSGNRQCQRAQKRLNDSIVVAVTMGIDLPPPEQVP